MAPNAQQQLVQWQTSQIIHFLLQDDDEAINKECQESGHIETDGEGGDFDPVAIADKLRSVGDALNDDVMFRAVLGDLRGAAAPEAVEAAFSSGVETLCNARVSREPEVSQEVQLIRVSVALGLYVKKSCPDLKTKVCVAMNSFLNRRVGAWVTEKGGWSKVADISQ